MDLQLQFSEFVSKEIVGTFIGKSTNDKYFFILILDEFTTENGEKIINNFNRELDQRQINKLTDLDGILTELIKINNLPLGFTLVCGYVQDGLLWLKTNGDGVVILRRGKICDELISGDNSASGYLENHDRLIITNKTLFNKITLAQIARLAVEKNTGVLLSELKLNDEKEPLKGVITLIIDVEKKVNEIITTTELEKPQFEKRESSQLVNNPNISIGQKINSLLQLIKTPKKTITFAILAILFLVFFWSVGLGVKRRADENNKKIIISVEKNVSDKLTAAEEAAFLDLPKAQQLLDEAKKETVVLSNLPKNYQQSIINIQNKIKNTEEKIMKKEEKTTEEFYDLKLEEESAQAKKMVLDKETALLYDQKNSKVYRLSLTKKKIEKFGTEPVGSVNQIFLYDETMLLFSPTSGVYKSNSEGVFKKVIEKDKDWGSIRGLSVYNGNIYLLDSEKDEIYKYLVAEGGYSDKNSYFGTGEATDLKDALNLMIDSAVYIGFPDFIVKYKSGVREEFKTSYPDSNVKLEKIYTDINLQKIYGWDKKNGVIYVLGKNGTYERQIGAPILKTATDFVVFQNDAYILKGNLIYKMNVE